MNTVYNDLIIYMDKKDSDHLEFINKACQTGVSAKTDLSKFAVQIMRNHLKNLQRNTVFFRLLNNSNLVSPINVYKFNGSYDCTYYGATSPTSCILATNLFSDNPDFNNYKKMISLTYYMLNKTSDFRYYDYYNDINVTSFILSKKYSNTIFFIPNKNINMILGTTNTINLLNYFNYSAYYLQNYAQVNRSIPNLSIDNFFQNLTIFNPLAITQNFKDLIFSKDSNSFNTFSLDMINNNNGYEINDVISLTWDLELINRLAATYSSLFKGVQIIFSDDNKIQDYNNKSLLKKTFYGNYFCNYFLNLYYIYKNNNKTNSIIKNYNSTDNFTSCFADKDAIDDIKKYLLGVNITYKMYLNRKTMLCLFNNEKCSKYKVNRWVLPERNLDNYTNTHFTQFSDIDLTVSKSQVLNSKNQQYVYDLCVYGVLSLLSYNILLWVIVFIVILLFLRKITIGLTTPIMRIKELVDSIGKESNQIELEDKDKFCDDSDLNELFQLCKNLVKGGFSNERSNSDKKEFYDKYIQMKNCYNNISYVKRNNLIIDEERIENFIDNNTIQILEYKRKEEESQNLSENNMETTLKDTTNKSIVNFHKKNISAFDAKTNTNSNEIIKLKEELDEFYSLAENRNPNWFYDEIEKSGLKVIDLKI